VWWKRYATLGVLLAVAAPDWGLRQVQPDWLERYGHRADEYRFPSGADKRQQFLLQVGRDGWKILAAIEADTESHWMLAIPAVDTDASGVGTTLFASRSRWDLDC
jgi:hypothetical protein